MTSDQIIEILYDKSLEILDFSLEDQQPEAINAIDSEWGYSIKLLFDVDSNPHIYILYLVICDENGVDFPDIKDITDKLSDKLNEHYSYLKETS